MSTSYTAHSPNEHALGDMIEASVVPDTSRAITMHSGETPFPEAVSVSVGESRNNNSSMASFYGKDEVVSLVDPSRIRLGNGTRLTLKKLCL